MKRLLSVILVLILILTVTCGCSNEESVEITESTVVIGGNVNTDTNTDTNVESNGASNGQTTTVITSTTQNSSSNVSANNGTINNNSTTSSTNNDTTNKGNANTGSNNGTANKGNANTGSNNGTANNSTNNNTSNNSTINNGNLNNNSTNNSVANNSTTNNSTISNSTDNSTNNVGTSTNDNTTNNNSTNTDVDNNTNNNNVNSDTNGAPKYDLKGAKITIVAHSKDTFPTTKGNTATSKAKYEALQQLQKDLNCKLDIKVYTASQIKSDLVKNQLSGIKYADIVSINIHETTSFILNQSIVDLNTVKSLDLSKSYMNYINYLKTTSIKGKNFMAITANTVFGNGKGVFFNKSILKELGYSENYIYDLVKSGKWTLATLRKLSEEAVLDKDGKTGLSTNDRFGMCVTDRECSSMEAILAAHRVELLKNTNGNIKYNMTDESVIKALEYAQSFYNDVSYGPQGHDPEIIDLFKTGHGLFLITTGNQAYRVSDMDTDYGFVPFPTVDGKGFNTWLNWNPNALSIPTGLSDTDLYNAGAFLQSYCYSEQDVVETRYNEFAVRYFRDSESLNYLKLLDQSTVFATSSMLCSPNFNALSEGTYRIIYSLDTTPSIKALIDSNKGAAITGLNDLLAKIK